MGPFAAGAGCCMDMIPASSGAAGTGTASGAAAWPGLSDTMGSAAKASSGCGSAGGACAGADLQNGCQQLA